MDNSIDEQVINFTAVYTSTPPSEINNSTTLDSIGIITPVEIISYIENLEENFGLEYEPGDEDGIVTVGNAAELIEKKLGVLA